MIVLHLPSLDLAHGGNNSRQILHSHDYHYWASEMVLIYRLERTPGFREQETMNAYQFLIITTGYCALTSLKLPLPAACIAFFLLTVPAGWRLRRMGFFRIAI